MYENIKFLEPLVEKMTRQKPCERPSATEALQLFNTIVQEQPPRSLRWALIHVEGTNLDKVFWTTESLIHEVSVFFKSLLSGCTFLSSMVFLH